MTGGRGATAAAALAVTAAVASVGVGPAAAGVPRGGSASFCSTARQLDQEFTHIDEVDPDESVDDLEVGEAAYRRLADEAPAKLRRPIRRILSFFPTLKAAASGELDIDKRKDGARFVEAATPAAKAFDKVFDYLDRRCDLDVD